MISAGCCVTSDTIVDRDKDYTGTVTKERASLVLRIAPTFLRYGKPLLMHCKASSNQISKSWYSSQLQISDIVISCQNIQENVNLCRKASLLN